MLRNRISSDYSFFISSPPLGFSEIQLVFYKGWRVGCNPPFVRCGIRLIGLPALQVALHQRLFALSTCRTAVSPFRIQHSQQLTMPHRHLPDGRSVSAPEPRLLPYALADVAILRVGGVSSSLFCEARKPHTNSPAQKYNA